MAVPASGDDWSLRRLLTEVIGSGPRSAEDMTRGQAREALQRILASDPDPTTLGAFLLANRWKSNTPTELAAFVDVMREQSVRPAAPQTDPVDCGANYDGKRESALLGVAAGLVAAAAGTPVVVHSADRVPTKRGTAYRHVLEELGVRTDVSPPESAAMTDEVGFGFYGQDTCNPGIHELLDRREQMGVRTFLNTIETLANPANARVHLGSFFHLPFARRVVGAVRESETVPTERVLMFQGLEGYDDVRPGTTLVAEWTQGTELTDFEIRTAEFGLTVDRMDLSVEDVTADSARLTERVLAGEAPEPFPEAVALNAALRIYAGEDCADLHEGLELARTVIGDGSAQARLHELRDF